MNTLCIGPGLSALEYQDYSQFNNFDVRIGCRHTLADPSWYPLDYVTTHLLTEHRWMLREYPEWQDKIVTYAKQSQKLGNTPPPLQRQINWNLLENQYSIQLKLAGQLGATHITTVGWDVLNNDTRTYEDTNWRKEYPVQLHILGELEMERIKRILVPINLALNKLKCPIEHLLGIKHSNKQYELN